MITHYKFVLKELVRQDQPDNRKSFNRTAVICQEFGGSNHFHKQYLHSENTKWGRNPYYSAMCQRIASLNTISREGNLLSDNEELLKI